ncbi:MAG: polysaccharide deacetylase family protein [Bacteroidota bacterium]|jgi:peptidoglycan/xylan/chitin deacetylase (PgdA/CDA1 family)
MIRNFLFHRVNPKRDLLWDPMDPVLFEKCIQHISKKYKVVLLEELLEDKNLMLQKNLATILFDDGYLDNLEYAAPILQKYNCKASFYVVTDCIEKNIPSWTHILEHNFLNTRQTNFRLNFEFLPAEFKIEQLTTKEKRIAFAKKLKPVLKKLSHQNREQVLAQINLVCKDVKLPKIMMNWDQVRELKQAGHYIGSHTVSHFMLGTMSNDNDIYEELYNSAKTIEKNLGYFPKTISYPVGSYNQQTIEQSKKAGYVYGLAVKQDLYNPKNDSLFEIPRIELYNESWLKTRLRISHQLEQLKKAIGY